MNETIGSEDIAEVEDMSSEVAPSKGSKIMLILGSAIFIAVVLYMVLFRKSGPDADADKRSIDKIVVEGGGVAPVREEKPVDYVLEEVVSGVEDEDFLDEEIVSEVPELPELPTLSQDISKELEKELKEELLESQEEKKEEVFTKEEVNKMIEDRLKKMQSMESMPPTIAFPDSRRSDAPLSISVPKVEDTKEETKDLEMIKRSRALKDRKNSPMFKMKGSGLVKDKKEKEADSIVIVDKDLLMNIEDTKAEVIPTKVPDMSRVVLQGKVIDAVLESSINTDVQAPVRAIVSRDVYAEYGKNILIPKGSRLIGSYQASVKRGQSRIMITWNRIIRIDGLSLNISAGAVDNLGRGGVEGDIDNKYAEILGNVFLSSMLSVATAIAVEEVTDTTGISNTTNTGGETTTTSGKPSDYAIIEATEDFLDRTKELVDEIAEQQPTVRIPQGTKIIVMVNQDLTLPLYKNR